MFRKQKYQRLRWVTVFLTSFMLPLGTFVGYQFGAGNTGLALISLGFQTALTILQAHIWWLTMEKMENDQK